MSYWESYILANYSTLLDLFGKPGIGSCDGKVKYHWTLELPDGTKYTVYDWKERNFTKSDIIEWHIGTNTLEESNKVVDYLNKNTQLNTYTNSYPIF